MAALFLNLQFATSREFEILIASPYFRVLEIERALDFPLCTPALVPDTLGRESVKRANSLPNSSHSRSDQLDSSWAKNFKRNRRVNLRAFDPSLVSSRWLRRPSD